jgi:hypothetical protein
MRLSFAARAVALAALLLPAGLTGTACAQYEMVSEATSIGLSALPDSAVSGRVVLNAALTTTYGQSVADGRIVFHDLSTMKVLGWTDVAQPSLTVEGLSPGRHVLRADYSGSAVRLPLIVLPSQSAELALDVLAKPVLTLSSSEQGVTPGALVTLVAAVTGSHGIPGGAVTFRDGDRVIAAHVPLDRTGLASFSTSALEGGVGGVVVVYEGDGRYAPASAQLDPSGRGALALVDTPRM